MVMRTGGLLVQTPPLRRLTSVRESSRVSLPDVPMYTSFQDEPGNERPKVRCIQEPPALRCVRAHHPEVVTAAAGA